MINNKDMKKRFVQIVYVALLFVATAVLSLSMTSCDEGGIDSQAPAGVRVGISAQPSYDVTASAAQVKFSVTSNTPWAITSDQSWCTVTPVSSSVSALVHEVTVEVLQNPDMKSRTAILTISGDGVEAQKVTIEQDARAELNVAMFETSDLVPSNGETRELTIYSNKSWRIVCDKSWLTFDVTEGEGSDNVYRVKATFEANTGSLRKALVTVKTNTVDSVYTVTQNGNQLEVANLADTIYNGSPQTKTYTISSNLDWKVSVDSKYDWIHITSALVGSGDGEVEVSVDPRYIFSSEARVGYIKLSPVTPAAGIEDLYIPIHQKMGFTISDATTVNSDGTLTMVGSAGDMQVMTNGKFGLGTFTWKFSSVNIPESGQLYIAGDGAAVNSKFWIYSTEFKFWSGGNDFNWGWGDMGMLSMQGHNLVDLKEWKLVFDVDPDNANKIIVDVYFNGDKIFTRKNLANAFNNKGNEYNIYFGCSGAGASCVVESVTFEPKE